MSQLTRKKTEPAPNRDSAIPTVKGYSEAGLENEALSNDASTLDATSSKLDALASYLDAAQKSQSYVSDWLYHRNDFDNSRNTHSVSPKTVIEIGASPAGSVGDGGYATDGQLNGSVMGEDSNSDERISTGLERSTLSRCERPLRPRSQSRSREEVPSPRSQRPRSPSPVRRHSIAVSVEEDVPDMTSPQSDMHLSEEDLPQQRERPLRPRSPSPVRAASPPAVGSRSRLADEEGELIRSNHQDAENDRGAVLQSDQPRAHQVAESKTSSQTVLQGQADTPSHSRSLSLDSTTPNLYPTSPTRPLDTVDHHRPVRNVSPAEEANFISTAVASSRRKLVQPPPPSVPMPPSPDAFLPPPPMMPAVFNIARSLAGARPRRRFSEPLKPATFRSRATQAGVDHGTLNAGPSYQDSSTQTTPVKNSWGNDPRSSGQSILSMASNASKGTQTTEHSSQPLSTSSSSSLFPLRPQHTSSSYATQNDPESYSSTSSLRQSLIIAKSESSPKKPPPNAKSTRISRILINPEALAFMRVPHEAHDAYIAVHRILSREEIIQLAELTIDIRETRSRGQEARERMWEQWRSERYKTEQ